MPLAAHLTLGARWTFIAGKGGVGKTTVAAALSIELAESGEGVTVLSTDPAHSLGDAFGLSLTGDPEPLPGFPSLRAFELDADREKADFLETGGESIATLIERGTYLDADDVEGITGLALPGIDELAALLRLGRLERESDGRTIVDTAPTGHTLRLLDLPAAGLTWLDSLEAMQASHNAVAAAFSRGQVPADRATNYLASLRADLEAIARTFRDPIATRFVLVANPEEAVLAETRRYGDELARRGIAIGGLVLNRMGGDEAGDEAGVAPREWSGAGLEPAVVIPKLAAGDSGIDLLQRFAHAAVPFVARTPGGEITVPPAPSSTDPAQARPAPDRTDPAAAETDLSAAAGAASHASKSGPTRSAAGLSSSLLQEIPNSGPPRFAVGGPYRPPIDRSLYFIGGKGGVGKTTVACAIAGMLGGARNGPVLLLSVDPAGSLGEILGESVTAESRPTRDFPGVQAQQLDATSAWSALTGRYRSEMSALFDGVGGRGGEASRDRELLTRLLDVAPPGVDELMAIAEVIDLLEDGQYDAVVVDTAPTGHFLRLLAMPAVALEWSHAILRLLLKYRGVVRLEGVGERVLELSRSLRALQSRLADPTFSWFGIVALPESLSIPETGRLIRSMQGLGAEPAVLIVNRVLDHAGRIDAAATRSVFELMSIDAALTAAGTPNATPPPTGREALDDFLAGWHSIQTAPG